MAKLYRAVGLFSKYKETEVALRTLIKQHGFPSEQISVVAKDKNRGTLKLNSELNTEIAEYGNLIPRGTTTGSLTGGTLGGITGLLVGLGVIAIPGVGPIMLAGAASTAIATAIAGSAIGATTGTLVGGLIGLGLPLEKAKAYRAKVVEGGCLTVVEGTIEELKMAEKILTSNGMKDWEVFDALEIEPVGASEIEQLSELEKPIQNHHLRMMATFSRLPEAKNALIELIKTGYPINLVTLFINDDDRHDWFPNLKVCDTLDYCFNRLPEERRIFFQDCFIKGKYILTIDGTDTQIRDVELALRSEGICGFYIFDPYDNCHPTTQKLVSIAIAC